MSGILETLSRFLGSFVIWVVVLPWEQAVRIRMGRHTCVLPGGVHWRIPLIDVVYKQSIRVRSVLLPTQTVVTADGHALTIGGSVGYAIEDIAKLYNSLHDAPDTILQWAGESLAATAYCYAKSEISPEKLTSAATERICERLAGHGLSQIELRLTDFAFPRALRLIHDQRWTHGGGLDVEALS